MGCQPGYPHRGHREPSLSVNRKSGGDGWFGTVGMGYDWQFNQSWVAGIFTDGQFGGLKGNMEDQFNGVAGTTKNTTSWAAGVRLGYLVAPNVLSYINGGYTGAPIYRRHPVDWRGCCDNNHTPSFQQGGWFLGGGVENSLNIFGISSPGWFMKTEYRAASYSRATLGGIIRRWRCDRLQHKLQADRSDRQHLAGLPLQLGWPGRREVLIDQDQSETMKAPASPGLFLSIWA